ncbi:diuretic hormone 45 [Bacillus rossius redtenbacheri]|uniref:diuretic hormone 45 n=1 Tax=Bacillus rossius redtenbacheri TaxID=93214 RepID=UPI002FDEA1F9
MASHEMVRSALLPTLLLLAASSEITAAPAYLDAQSLEALGELVGPADADAALLAAGKPNLQGWEPAPDPRYYLLTELDRDPAQQAPRRVKRHGGGPSLSIVNPLDVLRQRLLLVLARRRMRQSEEQIQANKELLEKIGKRDAGRLSGVSRFADLSNWSTRPRWGDDYASSH